MSQNVHKGVFEKTLFLHHKNKRMKSTFENLPEQVDYLLVEVLNIKEILLQRIEKPEEIPKYLDVEQALLYLKKQGYSMSKSKLYKLTAQRNIPCHKSDGRVYFTSQELDNWVTSQIEDNDKNRQCLLSQSVQSTIKCINKKTKKR